MAKKYIPHPPRGYKDFLIFIVRFTKYSNIILKYNGNIEMGIHQKAVGNFLNKNERTIYRYIKKAENDGLIKKKEKGTFF